MGIMTEMIRTNIEIDDKLIEEIKMHSKLKTKKKILLIKL
jgi:Arc/MetJ family transcription regulator